MTVTYIELATGVKKEVEFDSYFKGMKFVNELRHSKTRMLISYWRN